MLTLILLNNGPKLKGEEYFPLILTKSCEWNSTIISILWIKKLDHIQVNILSSPSLHACLSLQGLILHFTGTREAIRGLHQAVLSVALPPLPLSWGKHLDPHGWESCLKNYLVFPSTSIINQ